MGDKIIYLATTKGCKACEIQENILEKVFDNNEGISVSIMDFNDLPDWIKVNVPLGDFPTMIFVYKDVIKYHCSGTRSEKYIQEIINNVYKNN